MAAKPATAPEKARMALIAESGCLPCLLHRKHRQATIQHVTSGGRRLGHSYTYASCPWHHQAITEFGMNNQEMTGLLGPSFAQSKREFQETYGNEKEVLVRLQDWVLEQGHFQFHELHSQWVHLQRAN